MNSEETKTVGFEEQTNEISAEEIERALAILRKDENLASGALAGSIAAILGAAAWTVVTVVTDYQLGLMSIVVGVFVAFAVRRFGKGLSSQFQILSAALALSGCVLGNFFTLCYFGAQDAGIPFTEFIMTINPAAVPGVIIETFIPSDALFYGIAIYEAYKLPLRIVTDEELTQALDPFSAPTPL